MVFRSGRRRPTLNPTATHPSGGVNAAAGSTGISVLSHLSAILAEMDLRFQQRFESQNSQLKEIDLRYQQRFDAQAAALDAALLAAEKAASAALVTAEKAILKAEVGTEQRLTLLNELRTDVATVQQLEAVSLRIADIKERLDRMEGAQKGAGSLWGYAVAAVGVVGVVVAIIATLVR